MSEQNQEFRMINVQLSSDVRASINILKKRYKARSVTEALRAFIREHDEDVLTAGQRIARIESESAQVQNDAPGGERKG